MKDYTPLASDDELDIAVSSYKNNGMQRLVVPDKDKVGDIVLDMIPKQVEVSIMTSLSLDTAGVKRA